MKTFLARRVHPEGMSAMVWGMGGSISRCCRPSAMIKKALKPMHMR